MFFFFFFFSLLGLKFTEQKTNQVFLSINQVFFKRATEVLYACTIPLANLRRGASAPAHVTGSLLLHM